MIEALALHTEAARQGEALRKAAVETARQWDQEGLTFYANRLFAAATQFKRMSEEAQKQIENIKERESVA